MPTVQSHFPEETYLHLINEFGEGERSEAIREAYETHYGLTEEAEA